MVSSRLKQGVGAVEPARGFSNIISFIWKEKQPGNGSGEAVFKTSRLSTCRFILRMQVFCSHFIGF